MKKIITTIILLAMLVPSIKMLAQVQQEEYLGLPGDNLNLYAVMKLFQESETLEGFEKSLNDENSRINNLDLNGDNFVDYIRVLDYADEKVHNIVLQVAINSMENQDVAVFIVQEYSDGQVQIQLIGDEKLYGKNYIVEPISDDPLAGLTPNPGYVGNTARNEVVITTTYEIARWPVVRYIYLPNYVVWRSAWYWNYYPSYWHTWKPYYWHYYYGYHYNWYNSYYSYYRRGHYPRYNRWNDFYYSGKRSHSRYVSNRIMSGDYNNTYSKPNQRRHGEALYARTNPKQSTYRTDQATGRNMARSSDNQINQKRQSTSTNTNYARRTSTASTRSAAKLSSRQSAGSVKKSTDGFNKSGNNRKAVQSSVRSRTNSNATKSISNSRSSGSNKSGTVSKSRSTSKPTATKASSSRNRNYGSSKSGTVSKNRATPKPAATRASSSNNRSNGSSKSGTVSKSRSSSKPTATRASSSNNRSSGSSKSGTVSKSRSSSKPTATRASSSNNRSSVKNKSTSRSNSNGKKK